MNIMCKNFGGKAKARSAKLPGSAFWGRRPCVVVFTRPAILPLLEAIFMSFHRPAGPGGQT
jgi:hypothetical protein